MNCMYNVYAYIRIDAHVVHIRRMDNSWYIVWEITTQHYVPPFKRFIMRTIYMIVVNKSKAIRERERATIRSYTWDLFVHDIQIKKNISIRYQSINQYDHHFNM